VVESIVRSTYWPESAIFISFDDNGGFYDHVARPQVDDLGPSFRVPALVISPYAKGVIRSDTLEVSSILCFVEVNFGLPSMTHHDGLAADFMNAFDFTAAPRPESDFLEQPPRIRLETRALGLAHPRPVVGFREIEMPEAVALIAETMRLFETRNQAEPRASTSAAARSPDSSAPSM
jgi:phospholipase C